MFKLKIMKMEKEIPKILRIIIIILDTYHGLVEMQFVGSGFVGRGHGSRSIHPVVDLVERVETRASVGVRDGFAQQLVDLDGVCC